MLTQRRQEGMLPTSLDFPKNKRVIDHYSILARTGISFLKDCFQDKLNAFSKEWQIQDLLVYDV